MNNETKRGKYTVHDLVRISVLVAIMLLLVLTGLGAAILLNNGTNLIFGTISFVTNAAGSILQLAVSLDYSVFLIHRFAECRAADPSASPEDCMVDALCRSTGSILSSGLTTALEFLMSAEIAKTFLLQNLESVVPLAATFALRAMMSLMLHWEMQGGHRSGRKKEENDAGEEKE